MKGCKKIGEIENKVVYVCEVPKDIRHTFENLIKELRDYLKQPEIKEFLNILKRYIERKRKGTYYALMEEKETKEWQEQISQYEKFPIVKDFVAKIIGMKELLDECAVLWDFLSEEEQTVINLVMDRVLEKVFGHAYWWRKAKKI